MSIMKLDRTQACGEVFGHHGGARYVQNGLEYDKNGDLLGDAEEIFTQHKAAEVKKLQEQAAKAQRELDAMMNNIKQVESQSPTLPPTPTPTSGKSSNLPPTTPPAPLAANTVYVDDEGGEYTLEELKDIHHNTLKSWVEDENGEYVGKTEAIAFLIGAQKAK